MVDLASMRDAIKDLHGDPDKINPLVLYFFFFFLHFCGNVSIPATLSMCITLYRILLLYVLEIYEL